MMCGNGSRKILNFPRMRNVMKFVKFFFSFWYDENNLSSTEVRCVKDSMVIDHKHI